MNNHTQKLAGDSAQNNDSAAASTRFLPNFCAAPALVEILVIAELVAMILTMARGLMPGADVFADFVGISLFMLWQALGSAALLCLLRRRLINASARLAYLACYAALIFVTLLLSLGALYVEARLQLGLLPGLQEGLPLAFISRNISISAIVSAIVMRHFYIQYEWQRQVESIAASRIAALQARIRPHFLFNSLNTVAALIHAAPDKAERGIEDLADLFRASLNQPGEIGNFGDEVELTELYLRLEKERLGDRLQIEWQIEQLPQDWPIPRLTLQPLLENAIYHGIEKMPEGGRILIKAAVHGDYGVLRIVNPLPSASATARHGLNIAIENTRERLQLALGKQASLTTVPKDGSFETILTLPRRRN